MAEAFVLASNERTWQTGRQQWVQRLQQLADGFAVVIGGAARDARLRLLDRLEHRTIRREVAAMGDGIERAIARAGELET
ncbi:hypothetical protein, partial [Streptomyces sp. P17]|uniref:hypothetical protein n=1 Tax=Streptomyces sp. P17 TaxID=3074716 RepID=UPI0028F4290F